MNARITKKHMDAIRRNNISPGKKCRWVYRYGFVSIGESLQMTYTNKPKRLHGFVVEENMRRFAHVVSTLPIAWDKAHKPRTTIY
jgi:hypothetical protein